MVELIFAIVILGAALFLIEQYVPMAPPMKVLLRVVVILVIVYFLFRLVGLVGPVGSLPR